MAYVAIPDSELDPEEPILSTTIKQLRDNASLVQFYEEMALKALDNNFSSGNFSGVRNGGVVSLTSDGVCNFGIPGSGKQTSSGFIPANLRPNQEQSVIYYSDSAGIIRMRITSTGTILLTSRDYSGTLLNRTDSGSTFSITYSVL